MIIISILVIIIIFLYIKYQPNIDIVLSDNKSVILLWYCKHYKNNYCERTYIKLFEIPRQ